MEIPKIPEIEEKRAAIALLRKKIDSDTMDWLVTTLNEGKVDLVSLVTEKIHQLGALFYRAAVTDSEEIFGSMAGHPDIKSLTGILIKNYHSINKKYEESREILQGLRTQKEKNEEEGIAGEIRQNTAIKITDSLAARESTAEETRKAASAPLIIREDDSLETLFIQYQIRSAALAGMLENLSVPAQEKIKAIANYRENLSQALQKLEPEAAVKKAVQWLEFMTNTPSGIALLHKRSKEDLMDTGNPILVIALYLLYQHQSGTSDARNETFSTIMSKNDEGDCESEVSEEKLADLFANIDNLGIDAELARQMKKGIARDLISFELRSIKTGQFRGSKANPASPPPLLSLSPEILEDLQKGLNYNTLMNNDPGYYEALEEKIKPQQLLQLRRENFCHNEIFDNLSANLELLLNALAQADQELYHQIVAELIETLMENTVNRDTLLKRGILMSSPEEFVNIMQQIADELGLITDKKSSISAIIREVHTFLQNEKLKSAAAANRQPETRKPAKDSLTAGSFATPASSGADGYSDGGTDLYEIAFTDDDFNFDDDGDEIIDAQESSDSDAQGQDYDGSDDPAADQNSDDLFYDEE